MKTDRSIDDLAKEYCDFNFLKNKPQGSFDLAKTEDIIFLLRNNLFNMRPEEANDFF